MNQTNYAKKIAFVSGFLGLFFSIFLFVWVSISHTYRPSFEDQFETFHDGVNLFEVPAGYPESRDKNLDQFDYELYQKVRSVDDAIDYLKKNYTIDSDITAMHAIFDFTSKRFVHRMYPRHTWKTNPFFAAIEVFFPSRSINEMATAEELLRHSAVGGCGDTTATSITLFRAFGYQAQYVSLDGHHIGEFIAGGKKWIVDADMEVISPHSIEYIKNNLDLIHEIYAKYPQSRQNTMKRIFGRKTFSSNGFDGAPKYSNKMWNFHKFIEFMKWVIPVVGFGLSGWFLMFSRRKYFVRQA